MQPSEFSGISGLLGKAAGSPGDAGSLRQRERSGPSASGSNSPRLAQTPPGPAASSKKPVHSPSLWPFIYSSSNHPVSRAALGPDVRFARESQEPRTQKCKKHLSSASSKRVRGHHARYWGTNRGQSAWAMIPALLLSNGGPKARYLGLFPVFEFE